MWPQEACRCEPDPEPPRKEVLIVGGASLGKTAAMEIMRVEAEAKGLKVWPPR